MLSGYPFPLVNEAYQGRLKHFGEKHQDTLMSMLSLARIKHKLGETDNSIILSRRALDIILEQYGNESMIFHQGVNVHFDALKIIDKQAAISLAEKEIQHRIKVLGEEHPYTTGFQKDLTALLDGDQKSVV